MLPPERLRWRGAGGAVGALGPLRPVAAGGEGHRRPPSEEHTQGTEHCTHIAARDRGWISVVDS